MWNVLWSRDGRRNGGWVAVLVTAALVALVFGVCDTGGHHRAPVPSSAATQAGAHPELAVGCPDGDRPCEHADDHTATQLQERRTPDGAAVLKPASVQTGSSRADHAPADGPASSAVGSGRDLLCKACVSRT
ncbi:hypothetical protein BCL76_11374 [Streptomyces sp. CG 926]|nr:hypothetical protein BCL76_11374 [Streptomyces sp. CG 926]